jgi:hypothetical protein
LENSKPAFASQDSELIKKCIQFYIQNGPYLSESEKSTYTALYHRMGRFGKQSSVLREPVENPDAPHLRETLFDDVGG